jgi:hypothetical protein
MRPEYAPYVELAGAKSLLAEVDFGADCLWVYVDSDPEGYAVVVGSPEAMIALCGDDYGPNWCVQIHKDAQPVGDVSYEGPDDVKAYDAFREALDSFR